MLADGGSLRVAAVVLYGAISMRAHVLLYGLVGGVLIAGLKFIEYRWLLVQHSVEIYGALVAAVRARAGA